MIPYVRRPHLEHLFLLVKDRKYDELTFISGTCRKKCMEHPIQCASRELKEETKQVLDIDLNEWSHRHVVLHTRYYEPEPEEQPLRDIETTYHLYFVDITAACSSVTAAFFAASHSANAASSLAPSSAAIAAQIACDSAISNFICLEEFRLLTLGSWEVEGTFLRKDLRFFVGGTFSLSTRCSPNAS